MFCNKYSKRLKMLSLVLCIIIVFAQITPIVYADSDTRESTPTEQTSNAELNSEEKPDSSTESNSEEKTDSSTESNLDEKIDSSTESNSQKKPDSSTESDTEKPDSSIESNLDEKNDSSTESNSEEKPDSSTEPNSEEKPDLNSETSSDSKSDSSVETDPIIESDQKNETDMEPDVPTEPAFEKEEVNKEVMTPIELLDLKMVPKWNIYEITYENAGKGDIKWYVDNIKSKDFSIQNEAQLQGLADIVNGRITKIVTTISVSETIKNDLLKADQNADAKVGENAEITDVSKTTYQFDFSGKTVSLDKDINLSENWNPIGTETNPYKGTFDGKGKSITGLTILNTEESLNNYTGFFGYTKKAEIHNLLLEAVNVQGNNYVGALVGLGDATIFENIGVSGAVKGNNQVAGLVGYIDNATTISGCYFYGSNKENLLLANLGVGTINKSYVLGVPNEENKTILSEEDFANGKAAYLLDNDDSNFRTYAWTKGTKYPILADSAGHAVYKISVNDGIENGSISVVSYAAAGSDVEVKSNPLENYILKSLEIKTSAETKNECGKTIFFKMPEADVELLAEFIQKPEFDNYNVTFITNGGTIEGSQAGEEEHIVQVEIGEKVNKPAICKVENGITYSLMGWYEDKTFTKLYDFNSPIMSEIKLYARWIESEAMLVKFDLNNASDIDGVVCPEEQKLLKGELIKKPDDPKWNGEFVDGVEIFQHKFLGWSTKKEKGEIWDFDKNTISFDTKDSDLTLYAQWEDIDYFATGTKEAPCEIRSEIILEKLRDKVNEGNSYKDCYFKQTKTLKLANSTLEGENVSWVPIGTERKPFAGKFDGNGYTILGLIINQDIQRAGLFGTVSGGSLTNIKVTGNIKGGYIAGGIAGYIDNATRVNGCIVDGSIEGDGAVGGIIGYIHANEQDSFIEECINNAKVTSTSAGIGGIVGYIDSSASSDLKSRQAVIVKDCVNRGDLNVNGDSAGGIVGKVKVAILDMDNCTNNGKVTGTRSYIGGLVANMYSCRNYPSSIINCTNLGEIAGASSYSAGIVADAGLNCLIAECHNKGRIATRGNYTGGILGRADDYVTIRNCVNDSHIIMDASSNNNIGGIAGLLGNHASITGCHNTVNGTLHKEPIEEQEEILPNNYVGGIAGKLGKSVEVFENCSNKAQIKSNGSYTGGLVGKMEGAWQDGPAMKNLINYGDVSSMAQNSSSSLGGVFGYAGYAYQRLKFITNEGNVTGIGGQIGGLCGYIDKYSQIYNSYNVGNIKSTAKTVKGVGGLVGVNNDERTSFEKNCHNFGKVISIVSKNVGYLAGTNTSRIKNCYYLSDEKSEDGGRTSIQFKNGQVAYELDNGNESIRTYNWSQGSSYPIFRKDANEVYTYNLMNTKNGVLTPVTGFVNAGQTVIFEVKPNAGYLLSKVIVSGDDGKSYIPIINGTKVSFNMPQANVIVYAEFKEKDDAIPGEIQCNVNFDSNGGSLIDPVNVICGDTIIKPRNPEKEGYVFKGWFVDKDCNIDFNFGTAIINDIILYAKWVSIEENQITVTFHLNGASGEVPNKQILTANNLVEKPLNPVWKTNGEAVNKFIGWYTEKHEGRQWNFTEDRVNSDLILYAHWSSTDKFLSGTKDSPFIIEDETTLKEFAESVNDGNGYGDNYFKLGNDITITNSDWPGIGYVKMSVKNDVIEFTESGSIPFKGKFNGNGHTITLNNEQEKSLFGAIGNGGIVENLRVNGTLNSIPMNGTKPLRFGFGGIAFSNFGKIINCNTEIFDGSGGSGNVSTLSGGIVGVNTGLIKGCTSRVEFYQKGVASNQFYGIGGIAGHNKFGDIIENTVKEGTVIVNTKQSTGGIVGVFGEATGKLIRCNVEKGVLIQGLSYVGGIVGNSISVEDCSSGANIIGSSEIGGIAGTTNAKGEIKNCYWYGEKIVNTGGDVNTGLIIGNDSGSYIENCYAGFKNDNSSKSSVNLNGKISGVKLMTTEQFNSGEVAYWLDGGEEEHRNVWTQDQDIKMPVLGEPTYYRLSCDITDDGEAENAISINGNKVTKENSKFSAFSPSWKVINIDVQLNPGYTKINSDRSKVVTTFEFQMTANGEDITKNYKTYKLTDKNCDIIAKFTKIVKTEKVEEPPVIGNGDGGDSSSNNKGSGNGNGKGTGNGQGDGIGSGTNGDSNTKGDGNSATGIENGSTTNKSGNNLDDKAETQDHGGANRTNLPAVTDEIIDQPIEEVVIEKNKEQQEEIQQTIALALGSAEGTSDGEDDEEKFTVFEIVSRKVKENPLVAAALVVIIFGIIIAGGIGRTRKNKTKM